MNHSAESKRPFLGDGLRLWLARREAVVRLARDSSQTRTVASRRCQRRRSEDLQPIGSFHPAEPTGIPSGGSLRSRTLCSFSWQRHERRALARRARCSIFEIPANTPAQAPRYRLLRDSADGPTKLLRSYMLRTCRRLLEEGGRDSRTRRRGKVGTGSIPACSLSTPRA